MATSADRANQGEHTPFSPAYLRQLEMLRLRSRRSFLGTRQGGHLSLKRGHGIEFSDYRKYELGDSPRNIDWGVYGRTDKLYVKRFQEEQDLPLIVLVDGSNSMLFPIEDSKFKRAREVALSLTYVALLQQDSATISIPGRGLRNSYVGPRGFHKAQAEFSETWEEDTKLDLLREVRADLARVRFPGVAIFISDLMMPLEIVREIMAIFRSKNLDTSIIQVIGSHDRNPFLAAQDLRFRDSETGKEVGVEGTPEIIEEYRYRFDQHTQLVKEIVVNQNRFSFSQFFPEDSTLNFLFDTLPKTGLLR